MGKNYECARRVFLGSHTLCQQLLSPIGRKVGGGGGEERTVVEVGGDGGIGWPRDS